MLPYTARERLKLANYADPRNRETLRNSSSRSKQDLGVFDHAGFFCFPRRFDHVGLVGEAYLTRPPAFRWIARTTETLTQRKYDHAALQSIVLGGAHGPDLHHRRGLCLDLDRRMVRLPGQQ